MHALSGMASFNSSAIVSPMETSRFKLITNPTTMELTKRLDHGEIGGRIARGCQGFVCTHRILEEKRWEVRLCVRESCKWFSSVFSVKHTLYITPGSKSGK